MDDDRDDAQPVISWGEDPEAQAVSAAEAGPKPPAAARRKQAPAAERTRVCRVARCATGLDVKNTIDIIVPWDFSV